MLRPLLSLWLFVAMTFPAAAQSGNRTAAAPWPREVQQIYDELKAECRTEGGKFIPDRARFASQVEVTNDGKPDWIVEYDATRCSTSGSSAYCGTAGCSIAILASGRTGLTPIFNDNVRGWDVVDVAPRRKGLSMSVHGTACGTFGAEICRQTIVWNGRKWDVVATKRGMDAAEERAMAAEAAAFQPTPPHSASWISAGKGKDALAAVTDHPSFAAVGLRCNADGGFILTVVPKADFPRPPAGRDLMLSFTGSTDEIEFAETLRAEPGKPDFSQILPNILLRLLSGRDDSLGLLASIDGGDEWQELEYLSLAGSSAAIRTLQTQCAGAVRAAPATTVAATGAGARGKVAFPPIPEGFYARDTSCAAALASRDANGLTDGLAYFSKTSLAEWDGGPEINGFEALGGNRFLVRARSFGNGGEEDDPGVVDNFTIRITGPTSFLDERAGSRYTHCPMQTVPKVIRDEWLNN